MKVRTDHVLHINDSSVYKVPECYRGNKENTGETELISPALINKD